MSDDFPAGIIAALDRCQRAGTIARFWLRDDDVVEPTPALERLLGLTAAHGIPLALAVIPEPTGQALAVRLAQVPQVSVTVHGWAHANHARDAAKKQELGAERPAARVLAELTEGFAKLAGLHASRFVPVLVPPWNRIAAALLPSLPALGFEAFSVYGPERPAPLRMINTHVDVMDWHGSRGCRDWSDLQSEIVARLETGLGTGLETGGAIGLLTHHLVHDAGVWAFLERLFQATARHPACRWVGLPELLAGG